MIIKSAYLVHNALCFFNNVDLLVEISLSSLQSSKTTKISVPVFVCCVDLLKSKFGLMLTTVFDNFSLLYPITYLDGIPFVCLSVLQPRLNLNIELLQTKCSDFMFNLPKAYIDNACYISVSSVGVFLSNLLRFNETDCFK